MTNSSTHEKTVAFVVVRLSSSRLPAKHLRTIGGRPMLQWVIDRLHFCNELDEIVLATVDEVENLPLKAFAKENGIACFWYSGKVDHVTTRLRRAAEAFDAEICVLVSGDCPLIDAPAIDEIIRSLKDNSEADTVQLAKDIFSLPPALQGIVANRRRAWQLADDLADRPELKEHQFPIIYQRPELFNPIEVRLDESLYMPPHRLSVDTPADLAFMNALYSHLDGCDLPFDLPHVVGLLKKRPDLRKINVHVHQCRLVENKKRVLFVVDAGGMYGYGHLTRCLELARQLTERLAWSTHFFIDDFQAETIIDETGFTVHWGAFARPVNQNRNRREVALESISCQYDLCIVDIFDQRGPNPGWRSAIGKNVRCAVLENTQPWTREADIIVIPNVLNKYTGECHTDNDHASMTGSDRVVPKIVAGERFLILRDEIRRISSNAPEKTLDVLVYLHDRERREMIRRWLESNDIRAKIIDGYERTFADDLARSHMLISGFGISFNEAVALGTLPVCWPDSDAHREDAILFFRHFGMEPLLIQSVEDVASILSRFKNGRMSRPRPLTDGTPDIVAEIKSLFDTSISETNL